MTQALTEKGQLFCNGGVFSDMPLILGIGGALLLETR